MNSIERLNLIKSLAKRPRQKNPLTVYGLLPVTDRDIEETAKEEFNYTEKPEIEDEENLEENVPMSPMMRKVYKD